MTYNVNASTCLAESVRSITSSDLTREPESSAKVEKSSPFQWHAGARDCPQVTDRDTHTHKLS